MNANYKKMPGMIWVLSLLLLGLTFFSCEEGSDTDEPVKRLSVADVQAHYQGFIGDYETKNGRKSDKSILWEEAEFKELAVGDAYIFPLKYDKVLYVSDANSDIKFAVNGTSFAFAYKEENKIRLETGTLVPTSITDGFTGYLLMEDWEGNPLRYFDYENGIKTGSRIVVKENQKNGRIDFAVNCTETKYFTCTEHEGGETCVLDRISLSCKPVPGFDPVDPSPGGVPGGNGSNGPELCPHPFLSGTFVPCDDIPCDQGYVKDALGDCYRDDTENLPGFKICNFLDIKFDRIPGDNSETSFTGEIHNIQIPAFHTPSRQHVTAFWGAWCVTYGSSAYLVNTSKQASDIFKLTWQQTTLEVEVWLNGRQTKPSTVEYSNKFKSLFQLNLSENSGDGTTYIASGGCENVSKTRLRYCK